MLRKYTLYLAGVLGLILGSVGCSGSHRHAGYLGATWSVVDSRSGIQGSCEWAGITTVELAARDAYTGNDYYVDFACAGYQGQSNPLPDSDYSVALYGYSVRDELLTSYIFDGTIPVYGGEVTPISGVLYYP